MRKTICGASLSVTLLALSTPAYAYLDPGTGSIILQGLIAGVAACGTVVSINYHRIKSKVRAFLGKPEGDKSTK